MVPSTRGGVPYTSLKFETIEDYRIEIITRKLGNLLAFQLEGIIRLMSGNLYGACRAPPGSAGIGCHDSRDTDRTD